MEVCHTDLPSGDLPFSFQKGSDWELLGAVPSGYTTCRSQGHALPRQPPANSVPVGVLASCCAYPLQVSSSLCSRAPYWVGSDSFPSTSQSEAFPPNSASLPFPFTGVTSALWSKDSPYPILFPPLFFFTAISPQYTSVLVTSAISFLEELNWQQRVMSA